MTLARPFHRNLHISRQLYNENQRLTFLRPAINPHSPYTSAEHSQTIHEAEKQAEHRLQSLRPWHISERRALFMFGRATEVHLRRAPNWQHIGAALDNRHPSECQFIYSAMLMSWCRCQQAKTGMTENRLRRNMDGGIGVQEILSGGNAKADGETVRWLEKLAEATQLKAAAEAIKQVPAESTKLGKGTKWTKAQIRALMDISPVFRIISVSDISTDSAIPLLGARSPNAVIQQCGFLKHGRHQKDFDKDNIRPLTDQEAAAIASVAKERGRANVLWKHLKGQLPGRCYAECVHLTDPRRFKLKDSI